MMVRSSNYSSVGNAHKPNSSNFTILTSSCYIFKYNIYEKLEIVGVGAGAGAGGAGDGVIFLFRTSCYCALKTVSINKFMGLLYFFSCKMVHRITKQYFIYRKK
jgi:hypothetical protein